MRDLAIFTNLFTSPKAIQNVLGEATVLSDNINVAGLQLDVEMYDFLSPDKITHYRSFIQARPQRLHQQRSIGRLLFAPTKAERLDRHTPENSENS